MIKLELLKNILAPCYLSCLYVPFQDSKKHLSWSNRHLRSPPQLRPPVRLPRQRGRQALPGDSAARRAPTLHPGLPASKPTAPPTPSPAAQSPHLCALPEVEDANPL